MKKKAAGQGRLMDWKNGRHSVRRRSSLRLTFKNKKDKQIIKEEMIMKEFKKPFGFQADNEEHFLHLINEYKDKIESIRCDYYIGYGHNVELDLFLKFKLIPEPIVIAFDPPSRSSANRILQLLKEFGDRVRFENVLDRFTEWQCGQEKKN